MQDKLLPAAAKTDERAAQATLLAALIEEADADRRHGRHPQGVQCAARALTLAEELGDTAAVGKAGALLALHRLRVGDVEGCIPVALHTLRAHLATGDLLAQSQLHATLSLAYSLVELGKEALTHASAAHAAARECGDRLAESWALNRMGLAYGLVGDDDLGLSHARQALEVARAVGTDEEAVYAAMINLGVGVINAAERQLKRTKTPPTMLREHLPLFEETVAVARATGNPYKTAVALNNYSQLLQHLGQWEPAFEQVQACRELARQHGFPESFRGADLICADLCRLMGRSEEARHLYESVLARIDENSDPTLAANARRALYEMHKEAKAFESALTHLERLHEIETMKRERLAEMQTRVLIHREELDRARNMAADLKLEADMYRLRAEELDRAAHLDALTGLFNRRYVDLQLPRLIERAAGIGNPMCLALLDIDHFKRVNDEHGHAIGDRVLSEIALVLRGATRSSDITARYGGEEFLVLLVDTPLERALEVCERIRYAVEGHRWSEIRPGLRVTVSLGLADFQATDTPSSWFVRSDMLLYAAKQGGRNGVRASSSP